MKLRFLLLSFLILLVNQITFAQTKSNFCGHEQDQKEYWKQNPAALEDFKKLILSARTFENINGKKRGKIIIPVVFHVIHNDGNENILDEKIISQMKVLNEDFQLLNSDTNIVDPAFKDLIANCNFEFRIATIDPYGKPTTGIEHIKSHLTENSESYGKLNQWNRSKYLNIWIVKSFPAISNGTVLGKAYLPSSVTGGLFYADGVTVLATEVENATRTLTHEVGHYLGLQHTFNSDVNNNQTGGDCGDDGIFDTPRTKGAAYNSAYNCSPGANNSDPKLCDLNTFNVSNLFNGVSTTSGKVDTTSTVGKTNTYSLNVNVGNFNIDTSSYIPTYPKGAKFIFLPKNLSELSSSKININYSKWPTGVSNNDTITSKFSQVLDTTKYYEITYVSSNANSVDLKGIQFIATRNAEGVRSVSVRTSADNFKSNLPFEATSYKYVRNMNNVATFKKDTTAKATLKFYVNSPKNFTDLREGKKITLRIYGWNAEATTGTLGLDSMFLLADSSKINVSRFSAVGLSNNSSKSNAFAFSNWELGGHDKDSLQSNLSGNINLSKYYEFSISANKRKMINIDSITFLINRNNSGVRNIELRSSIDNYASALNVTSKNSSIASVTSGKVFYKKDTTQSVFLKLTTSSNNFKNIRDSKTINFRIYGYNAEDNIGTLEIDSLNVYGLGSTIENYQNYMDYSTCANMFTKDQASLMTAILTLPTSIRNNLIKEDNLKATGTDEIKTVTSKPVAYFNSNISHLCAGGLVTFKDRSWGSKSTSRTWYFEGGSPATDTVSSPKVIFDTPGYKKVVLRVKNEAGEDSLVMNNAIYVSPDNAEVTDLFSYNFNEGNLSNWLVVNEEDNYAKFQNGNGRWGSKGITLNNFKDVSNATLTEIDDVLYFPRLTGNKDAIISPSIDFSKLTDSRLNFDYAYATTSFYDSLISEKIELSYSTNCGRTWIPFHTICYNKDYASTSSVSTELITAGIYSGKAFFPNSDDVWKTAVVDLSEIEKNSNDTKVRIKMEFTASSYSNNLFIDNINLFGTVSVAENPISAMDVMIVPNPTSNDAGINIEFNGNNEKIKFELIDLQGKVISSDNVNTYDSRMSHKMNLTSKLNAGFYTLRISQGEYTSVKKVVIQ
jgi:hypothetical protein